MTPRSILLALALIALSGCQSDRQESKPERGFTHSKLRTDEDLVIEAVLRLEKCPAWASVPPRAGDQLAEIERCLRPLSLFRTEVLREAIAKFIEKRRAAKSYRVDEWSKLFVLNRQLFNVPQRFELSSPPSASGWQDVPQGENWINLLWPFTVDALGNPRLTEPFAGFLGGEYDALDQFDQFEKHFGRRIVITR